MEVVKVDLWDKIKISIDTRGLCRCRRASANIGRRVLEAGALGGCSKGRASRGVSGSRSVMAVPACSVSKCVLPCRCFSTMFMHTSSPGCHQETRVARSAPSYPLSDVCSSCERWRCRLGGGQQRVFELQRLVSTASGIPRHLPDWLQFVGTCGAFGTRLSWMSVVHSRCTPSPTSR